MGWQVDIEISVADFDGYVLLRIVEVTSNDDAFSIFIDGKQNRCVVDAGRHMLDYTRTFGDEMAIMHHGKVFRAIPESPAF